MQQPGCACARTRVHVCACVHVFAGGGMHSVRAGHGAVTHRCQMWGSVPGQPWACQQGSRCSPAGAEGSRRGGAASARRPGASGGSPGAGAAGRFQRTGCRDLSPHF